MRRIVLALGALLAAGCGGGGSTADHGHPHAQAEESWAITGWGEKYEVFAESEPLVAGRTARSHTHVTILEGFAPLEAGAVSIVLARPGAAPLVYRQDSALRAGIFSVEIEPAEAGEYVLMYRIESAAGAEEIRGATVRVGGADSPAELIGVAQAPWAGTSEPVGFLKEQQWRTEFRTEWAREGTLRASVRGPGRTRAAAGSEVTLAAPLDGVVTADRRAFVGLEVAQGAPVLELAPRASSSWTAAELQGEAELARARLARLESLLALEAASSAEVEGARVRSHALETQLAAVRGSGGEGRIVLRAPFHGRVAQLHVTPGQAVSAGEPLARFVRPEPVWIEVPLAPAEAMRLHGDLGGLVLTASGLPPIRVEPREMRLVSRAPEVDPGTGNVLALFEVTRSLPLPLGTAVEAEVLLADTLAGVVVPSSAVVDDGGVPVVYVQIEGESFAREEVRVERVQGEQTLLGGLPPGARVVTRGGGSIRRAALMSSGAVAGHVH